MNKHVLTCLIALSLFGASCTGDLPLSDLVNNTVTLKVLGTYESNDPHTAFTTLPMADIFSNLAAGTNPNLNSTSLSSYATQLSTTATAAISPRLAYYIDIAEIRLAQGQGKSSSQTIADYWSQFAISRQLMCSSYSSADGRSLANCSDSNGIQRLTDFFNGGFTYPAVDVASGNYNHMGIYFRRFATYPAATFTGDGFFNNGAVSSDGVTWAKMADQTAAENATSTTFDNRSIYGFDVESFLLNQYGETATEPRMFPLQRKDLSLQITNGAEPYVLEVRVFLQNLMMVHLRQIVGNAAAPATTSNAASVYIAPADWNIAHMASESDGSGNSAKQGGSVLMTARVYQPKYVGYINMSAQATATEYFAVVPAGSAFPGQVPTTSTLASTAILPLAATNGLNTKITNLSPGSYDVYRVCDKLKCAYNSPVGTCNQVSGTDGFPETVQKCGGTVSVTANSPTNVTTCSGTCP